MFVQNHHSLEELQRLTKALTKKRIWPASSSRRAGQAGPFCPRDRPGLGVLLTAPFRPGSAATTRGGLAALQERPHTGRPPRLAAADVPRYRDRLEAGPTPEDGVCTFRCQDLHASWRRNSAWLPPAGDPMTCCIASITAA